MEKTLTITSITNHISGLKTKTQSKNKTHTLHTNIMSIAVYSFNITFIMHNILTTNIIHRSYLKKLSRQLNGIELTTYSLYLQYERIKCYMHLKEFKATRPLTKTMFNDACTLGSIAWQVNALMLTMISESKLGNGLQCIKTIEFIISLSRTLGDDNVTAFMRKV